MRKDEEAWAVYQKARTRRAKAEIAVIEKRAAAEAAEQEFDTAHEAELAASDAWRRSVAAEKEPEGKA